MARNLATVLAVTLSLNYLSCANAYNIDTSNPIIYDDVARDTSGRGTYFGYAVLFNSYQNSLLIGAPRANSSYQSDVNEPGVVYKCDIAGQCTEIYLDSTGNNKQDTPGSANIWDLKNQSWIGGAMDSERSPNGRVVICAPRWVNQYYQSRNEYYMTGLCYFMRNNNMVGPAQRLTPTTADSKMLFSPPPPATSVYFYGMSQAGISVHMMQDNAEIGMLLGVPGLLNWRGGIVEYPNQVVHSSDGRNKRSTVEEKEFKEPNIVTPYPVNKPNDFDLLGYQVSSGRFFNSSITLYVASSPRGDLMLGYVLILLFPPQVTQDEKWSVKNIVQGQEFGEYFGYSLAVGNINGDDYDDLVVGAPMYSNNGKQREIGRIHVFLGSILGSLQVPKTVSLIKGTAIDGRFGSTVVYLGDIDQDGFGDIAVGAPYENEHRGAIYIYNGSPHGLKEKYSQRITAAEVDKVLRGFGVSITPPHDIDDNLYNDIAVGSFLSGHAVLFRTYPVVKLRLYMKPSVNGLKNDSSEFFLSICQGYDGTPEMINVTRILKVDEKYNRATLGDGVKQEMQVTLQKKQDRCENVNIHINTSEDQMEDVKISVYQDVVKRLTKRNTIWIKPNYPPIGEDTFCKNCPVIEEASSQKESSVNLRYARECDLCKSNLHLSADFYEVNNLTSLNGEYVLGSGKIIRLIMNVTNDGDVSYGTFLTVDLPDNVNIGNLPSDCHEKRRERELLAIVCEFKRALRQGTERNKTLDLDMSNVDPKTGLASGIVFRIEVNSSSLEQDMQDNSRNLTLKLKTEAYLIIVGKSKKELYSYIKADEEEQEEEIDLNIEFGQKYQVLKIGRSPVQEMQIQIDVPMVWRTGNIQFLTMYLPEGRLGDRPVACIGDKSIKFLTHNIPSNTDSDIQQDVTRKKRSLEGVKTTEKNVTSKAMEVYGTESMNNGVHQYPSNRSLYLNCSMLEVQCYTIKCTARQFDVQSLEVELSMFLNVSLLESLMENKDIIHVATEGRVSITRPVMMNDEEHKGHEHIVISSTFLGSIPEKRVEIWIIVLSVVGGILLLLLISLGLVKAGFFRRKKKEELQALKNADYNFKNEGSVQLVAPSDE